MRVGSVRSARRGMFLAGLLALGALFTAAPGAALGAEGPAPLWQRCDGGPEDLSCGFPRGIGVNPSTGNIYIADQNGARIVELSAWGQFLRAFGWGVADGSPEAQTCTVAATCHNGIEGAGKAQFNAPQGVAVDTAGNVYVFDIRNNRVQKFDAEGHFLFMLGGQVNKTKVEEAKPEAEQNRCPVDPGDVCQKGTSGTGKGQFAAPVAPTSDLATGPSPNNLLYVGDKERVQVFNSNGAFKESFPDPEGIVAAGGTVKSLAAAPSGGLYLAFVGKPNVTRLTSAGKASVSPGCVAKVEKPTALASAQAPNGNPVGNLYVYDEATQQARQFSSACGDKEAPFAKGEITSSTGIAAGIACLSSGADVYLSNSDFPSSLTRAYGPAPDQPLCPKPLLAPEVTAEFTVSAGTTEAELKAQINPRFYADTTYQVQYGTAACVEAGGWEAACVQKQPATPALLGAPVFDFPATTAGVFLGDLQPATAYRYRFVAQSGGGGPVFGAERSFDTYSAAASGGSCPNEALRSGPSALLPDCRAYEMVSPVDKEGGDILVEADTTTKLAQRNQSAPSGERFTYSTFRAFGDAQAAPFTSQYVAVRGPEGWASHDISPPRGTGFFPPGSYPINPSAYSEYQSFSPDLCYGWLANSAFTEPPLAVDASPFNYNLYRRSDCGAEAGQYKALSKLVSLETTGPLQGFSEDGEVAIFRDTGHLSQEAPTAASAASVLGCESPTPLKALAYQWLRDGAPIPGKTSSSYTVNPAEDAGHTIQCRMTASGEGGAGSTQVANPAWVIAPYPATPPPLAPQSIPVPGSDGSLDVGGGGGQTLSCDPGSWEGSPSFEYRWYRNGVPIAGAEAAEYVVQAADLATPAYLQCEVIAENAGGTVVEASQPLATDPAPAAPVSRPNMLNSLPTSQGEALYASGPGGVRSVCILPGGVQAQGCSGGTANSTFNDGRNIQMAGALSSDGRRAFWTDAGVGKGRIFLRENPTAPQSALALGQATGTGKLTSGSALIEEVGTMSGAFAVGQAVSGQGIPFGTTILAVGAGTLTLSANATKSAVGASLEASSECTEADKACTAPISEAVEAPGESSRFWAASADGSSVLFSVGPSGGSEDLYLYDVNAHAPTLIAHQAFGVLGQSKDLSRIYFVSREALPGSGESSEGAEAQAGKPNLYLDHEGEEAFIATLSAVDAQYENNRRLSPVDIEPSLHSARVSGDGESAAFLSTAPLTGYDNTDLNNGEADAEAYLYQAATGKLACASCNPNGARPLGRDLGGLAEPFWIAAKLPNIESELYASHALSEDGKRLFFESFGPLALGDSNGAEDVYEWETPGSGSCSKESPTYSPLNEGCVSLISSGRSPQDSELLDATPSGSDVFIRTGASLVPQDPGSFDVYDARVEGGFPQPPAPQPPCEGEACQGAASNPAPISPASAAFRGAGNQRESAAKKKKKKARHKRHGRHRQKKAHAKQGRSAR